MENTGHQHHTENSGSPDQACPICLSPVRYGVRTNCGHLFCASCMITNWQKRSENVDVEADAMPCPLCRRKVVVLLTEFTAAEQQSRSAEKQQINDNINQYNSLYASYSLPWLQLIFDLPTLLRRCYSEVFSFSGLLWTFRIRSILFVIVAMIYFLSPVDLLPEALVGIFGYFDDLLLILGIAIRLSMEFRHQVASRARASVHR